MTVEKKCFEGRLEGTSRENLTQKVPFAAIYSLVNL